MNLRQDWSGAYLPIGARTWRALDVDLVLQLRLARWRRRSGLRIPARGSIRAPGLAATKALSGMVGIGRSGVTCEARFDGDDGRPYLLRSESALRVPPTIAGWCTLRGAIWLEPRGAPGAFACASRERELLALARIRFDLRRDLLRWS
ncbi:MAG TPA: hypothetical protein VF989_19260 [Polyangiaceae bacterium]|jgi:hypothetical protein